MATPAKYVTPEQLGTLADKQKSYIDTMDGKLSAKDNEIDGKVSGLDSKVTGLESQISDLDGKVTGIEVPQAADTSDISSIVDKFNTEA